MLRYVLAGMALGLALAGSALAVAAGRLAIDRAATTEAPAPTVRVQGEACTEACRREHSACMIAEKGSPTCNVRLQRCLQACLAGKRSSR